MTPVQLIASLAVLHIVFSFTPIDEINAPDPPSSWEPFYVTPTYRNDILSTIATASPEDQPYLQAIADVPTAVWLVTKESVQDESTTPGVLTARNALADAASKAETGQVPTVTFVVYNLPNRDCGAGASAGEICCAKAADGTCDYENESNMCEDGLDEYKNEYINPLANVVAEYCRRVGMVFVIEPDSLANLVTNLDVMPQCGNPATQAAYKNGIKYAVETLKKACPNVNIYVDAAHGGWLGWAENSVKYAEIIKGMNIASLLRGFAINVANYHEMGIQCPDVNWCMPESATKDDACCKEDACELSQQWNPGFTTVNYAASLKKIADSVLEGFDARFLIDTSRNGVADARSGSCHSWCNIKGAGVGLLPSTETVNRTLIDAYMWIKTPGESDGCTEILPSGEKCARHAGECMSPASIGGIMDVDVRAPEAGEWWDYQIIMLAKNGQMFHEDLPEAMVGMESTEEPMASMEE